VSDVHLCGQTVLYKPVERPNERLLLKSVVGCVFPRRTLSFYFQLIFYTRMDCCMLCIYNADAKQMYGGMPFLLTVFFCYK
jgi:hypothetical protein